ncbi:vacuolar protein-sorting-associated protein 37 homolog 2-like [Prunus avium]|uniref:Vacuolar protein-sorting-associated protein 37 homolog 2-like n=1 Tax=Prunus avium TaxID=42229 RepID=A0A6P5TUQ3_PRUAV|nr:vacuolar protein-sorting-associated protein 37 homolog 2-like [Prunus avium]
MSMFKFWGSQEEQTQPRPEVVTPSQSWYPPSVVNSPTSSRPGTPSSTSSSSLSYQRPTEKAPSPSHVSPAEAAVVINVLKDKRADQFFNLLLMTMFLALSPHI